MKNNESIFISFIVPIYNIENYLTFCIESLLSQGLNDTEYEIILVNDGSTDNSLSICLSYIHKYKNIYLINQTNQGVAVARNNGIDFAHGKYIAFIDGDDYYIKNSISLLIQSLKEVNSFDLIKFTYKITNEYSKKDEKITGNLIFKGDAYSYLHEYKLERSSVIFIYKKNFLINHNIKFQNYNYAEDFLFVANVFINNPTIIATDYPIYQYVVRPNSASTTKSIEHVRKCFEDHLLANTQIVELLNKKQLKTNNPQTYNSYKRTLNESLFDMFTRELLCKYTLQEHKLMMNKLKELELLPMQPWGTNLVHKLSQNIINILAYIPILYPTTQLIYRKIFYPHFRKFIL